MSYCHECGSEVGDDWEFCRECGSNLPPVSGSEGKQVQYTQPQSEKPNQAQAQTTGNAEQPSNGSPQRQSQQQAKSQSTDSTQTHQQRNGRSQKQSTGEAFTPGRVLAIMGAVGVGVAAFLPWVTASFAGQSVSIAGMEELGQFTLMGAGLVALVSLLDWSVPTQSLAVLVGLAVGLVGGLYVLDPLATTDLSSFPDIGRAIAREVVEPGMGAYLTALGGLSLLSGSTYDLLD